MILPTDVVTSLLDYSSVCHKSPQRCHMDDEDGYGYIWYEFHKGLSYPLLGWNKPGLCCIRRQNGG